ncbi:MAG: matrixin family metalloprotease [Deltaproteobacteria bacterium]|nr:matrixin family metalloprotease [Deltaproteobacteria bacterium]
MSTACAPLGAHAYTLRSADNGAAVHWEDMSVSFRVDQSLTAIGQPTTIRNAVLSGFRNWGSIAGNPFVFSGDGVPYQSLGSGDPTDGVSDVILVQSGWQFEPAYGAMTLVTYDASSGTIVDADILMNGQGYRYLVDPTPEQGWDLENVLTHEIGHLLGLGHAEDTEATMYATSERGETKKRSVESDDQLGFRVLYAFAGEETASGCSATKLEVGARPVDMTGTTLAVAVGLLLALLLGLRRRVRTAPQAVHSRTGGEGSVRAARGRHVSRLLVIALSTAAVAAPTGAGAAVVAYRSTSDLASEATDVFRGTVRSRRSRWDGRVIVTDVVVDVVDCWKGDCAARTRTVRELGGEVDGVGMLAPEPTALTVGTDAVLFARLSRARSGRRLLEIVGGAQGVFRLDPATEIATRELSAIEVPTGLGPTERVSLRRLRNVVEENARRQAVPLDAQAGSPRGDR